MSELYQSLSHCKWDCKYHVVFVPKKRRRVLFAQVRRHLGEIFHALARQKECQIMEGHLMPDHVHMCIAISPEVPGRFGGRVPEREERYRGCTTLRQGTQFHRRTPLGSGLCGIHHWLRVGANSPLHPRPTRSGWNRPVLSPIN